MGSIPPIIAYGLADTRTRTDGHDGGCTGQEKGRHGSGIGVVEALYEDRSTHSKGLWAQAGGQQVCMWEEPQLGA